MIPRPALPDETGQLQALEVAARQRYRAWPSLAFVADRPALAAERLRDGEVWVVDLDRVPAGFVLLQPQDGHLYIANISVTPAAAGRGVGAALLAWALTRAREQRLTAVTLTTFITPPWNGPWFRRQGYNPMPGSHMGSTLRATLERQATFLDPATRLVLWRPTVLGKSPQNLHGKP